MLHPSQAPFFSSTFPFLPLALWLVDASHETFLVLFGIAPFHLTLGFSLVPLFAPPSESPQTFLTLSKIMENTPSHVEEENITVSAKKSSKKAMSYRIGEFARRMCVTPDFLKHYGEYGILNADQRRSGYRWYNFHQSPVILECMRLKNCGVTIREMKPLITKLSGTDSAALLSEKIDGLRERVRRDQAVIDEYEYMAKWLKARHITTPLRIATPEDSCTDWEVRDIESLVFLPHSVGLSFPDDPKVQAILPGWVDTMPIVKSTLSVTLPEFVSPLSSKEALKYEETGGLPFCWGLMTTQASAEKLHIPLNEVIVRIPAGRAFIAHFADADPVSEASDGGAPVQPLALRIHPVLERLKALEIKPKGEMYMVLLMHARMQEETDQDGKPLPHERYGFFIVPLE